MTVQQETFANSPLHAQGLDLANQFQMFVHWNSMQCVDVMEPPMEMNVVLLPQEYPFVEMVHVQTRMMPAMRMAIVTRDSFASLTLAAQRMERVLQFLRFAP